MTVLYEDNHIIAVSKTCHEIVQGDKTGDTPLSEMVKAYTVRSNIKSGKMPAGTRLPTVRELADRLQVAQGTVKRTYDELESEQLIKKVQGRGTFVCYSPASIGSRKDIKEEHL